MLTEKGFTLLEMLVTLAITTALLLLPTYAGQGLKEKIDKHYFVNQFEAKLSEQQLYSMVAYENTTVKITPAKIILYNGLSHDGKSVHYLYYPEGIRGYEHNIIFHKGTGMMGGAKRVRFSAHGQWIEVMFQLVFGRYYIRM